MNLKNQMLEYRFEKENENFRGLFDILEMDGCEGKAAQRLD